MTLAALVVISLSLAALPTWLFFRNLAVFRRLPPRETSARGRCVSVLIPARNESRSISACVMTCLASEGVDVEVLVLDDDSSDDTAELVARLARDYRRVTLLHGRPLPEGWCGKQHACAQLAEAARYDWLAFIDADVRLADDCLARMIAQAKRSDVDLLSAFPRQETETFPERLLIPLIHFMLLGFLPLRRMRQSRHVSYAAGCGQLFLARREAYALAGGHAAIRRSLHDGLTLPRAFRRAGLSTDVCDGHDLATCRMYRGGHEVWSGLQKNATEGLAAPAMIVPATILLVGGQVMPIALLAVCAASRAHSAVTALALLGVVVSHSPRLAAVARFSQPWSGAILHSLGVAALLAIQWTALARAVAGGPARWKGREYRPRAIVDMNPAAVAAEVRA